MQVYCLPSSTYPIYEILSRPFGSIVFTPSINGVITNLIFSALRAAILTVGIVRGDDSRNRARLGAYFRRKSLFNEVSP